MSLIATIYLWQCRATWLLKPHNSLDAWTTAEIDFSVLKWPTFYDPSLILVQLYFPPISLLNSMTSKILFEYTISLDIQESLSKNENIRLHNYRKVLEDAIVTFSIVELRKIQFLKFFSILFHQRGIKGWRNT